ncbi:membrane protein [Planotetraspora thailandica]|uniref:Membrane protein n=1 Tax=Planotetraspora thailandica TaxID=487172 RepID=A0A8J3V1Q1_9ACTN|nr:hypothetical protein [Planotetraspora thailandica]GII53431.1 membrane protein [Planotetraspora thailandica]
MRKLIALIGAVTGLGLLLAASFLGALHRPEPHDLPIAVVGPPQVAGQIAAALASRAPGAFSLTPYADEQSARDALAEREVDAVLMPQSGKLVVASAGGRTASTAITQAFQAAAQAQGRPLAVEDAFPLPPGDAGGISGIFYVVTLVLPGIAAAALISRVAPGLGLGGRLAVLTAAAVVIGTANAWLADVVFDALPGRFLALAATSAGITLAVGLVTAGLLRLIGPAGVALSALLIILIGLPASGGPLGARFIPEWYAAVGHVLPFGSAAEAVTSVVHFGGAALASPLLVLGAWALLGLFALAAPRRRAEHAVTDRSVLVA